MDLGPLRRHRDYRFLFTAQRKRALPHDAVDQTIPDALRGRLAAIEMVSYMSGPLLGHVEVGAVAAIIGVRGSVISGGALCVVSVLVCGALLPRFVRCDARRFAAAASGGA